MRPSEAVIEGFSKLLPGGPGNVENVIEDFIEFQVQVGMKTINDAPEGIIDCLFGAFVAGLVSAMNPKSSWNKKFDPSADLKH